MTERETKDHWAILADQVGAEAPAAAPQRLVAAPPPAAPAARKAPPQEPPRRPPADWSSLAESLGIPAAPGSIARREVPAARPPVPQRPAPQARPAAEAKGEFQDAAPPRPPRPPRSERRPPVGEGGASVEERRQAEGLGEAGGEALAEGVKKKRGRRRRRGRKVEVERTGESVLEESLAEAQSFVETVFAEPPPAVGERADALEPVGRELGEEAFAEEVEPAEEARDADRKRRRRRRRGGKDRAIRSETAEAAITGETAQPAAAMDEAAEVLEMALEDEEEEGLDDAEARPNHKGIPTWEEAIGHIVAVNLENRARTPHGSTHGRARGPRGRGDGPRRDRRK